MEHNTDEDRRITADSDTLDDVYCELLDGLITRNVEKKQRHMEQALRLLVGSDVDTLKHIFGWK